MTDVRLTDIRKSFGAVEITVHNGQIVQIERKEKIRLQAANSRQA